MSRIFDAIRAGHAARGDEAREAAITDLLPGSYYMDPPDGGDASVREQFARMAKDAARYRWLRDNGRIDRDWFHLHWTDAKQKLDDAIDAAIAKARAAIAAMTKREGE